MLDLIADFKELGLHGMASAWPEVQGTARIKSLDHDMTLPLFRVALSPTITRPFCAVPRTSVARTASD